MCKTHITAGEPLFRIMGRIVDKPDRYSIQIGHHMHVTPEGALWAFVNHSCAPNTVVDFRSWMLVAHRSIRAGEELGWNYLTTEWIMTSPFQCTCGAPECLRYIRGFGYLDASARQNLLPIASPFLQSKMFSDPEEQALYRIKTLGQH